MLLPPWELLGRLFELCEATAVARPEHVGVGEQLLFCAFDCMSRFLSDELLCIVFYVGMLIFLLAW